MRGDWALAYALLCGLVDTPDADPADLDTLADAAWWLCRVEESIAHRQRAYAGHVAARAHRRAADSAWIVFFEHHLAGPGSGAAGALLERNQRLHRRLEAA